MSNQYSHEAYVIPGVTDPAKQREVLIGETKRSASRAILHFHSRGYPCDNNGCETYKDGLLIHRSQGTISNVQALIDPGQIE